MKPAPLLLATLLCAAAGAQAASPDAWKQQDKSRLAACLKASQLKDVKVVGSPSRFDDRVGYDALLLQGRYRPRHMNNRPGQELCLYHRASGRASVSEWNTATAR